LVTIRGGEREAVYLLEACDLLQSLSGKGLFTLECVEANAFQQVAEPEVRIFGKTFEHLEERRFHAHSGLDSIDLDHGTNPV
jgi:hypothetical protein